MDANRVAPVLKFIRRVTSLKPQLAVIYARVSRRGQKANLRHQVETVAAELRRLGFEVIAVFQEVERGWVQGRPEFTRAVAVAKTAGAVLVAEAVNRFWRNTGVEDSKWSPLTVFEMRRLLAESAGVQLATVYPPDASPADIHSAQTKRGQQGWGKRGGRPPKKRPLKERRIRLLAKVIEMHRAGCSYGQIAKQFQIARSTVRDWIKDSEKTAKHVARI